ncbi:hypothetical protein [Nitrosomonas sp.]|uniref:hypothetical protein n=1 Tax=Nitrosomonas sp. TaxID=42353 RepID=UPI0025D7E04D|nr:hypothetical protein [Nitrosomonas sp.]
MSDLYMDAHLLDIEQTKNTNKNPKSALQDWVTNLPIMQQSVLMSAIRGPDGIAKKHKCKPLIRWFRRCILLSAFEGIAIDNPYHPGGGSFTGPSCRLPVSAFGHTWLDSIRDIESDFVDSRDELPFHYILHFIHAIEIVGYKHPDKMISMYWLELYSRLVIAMHLREESIEDMNFRLSDDEDNWMSVADETTTCSD